jgi:DNA-binding NtrC family response regulator
MCESLPPTHNDLEKAIAAGKFRQDLFHRLNVVTLYVPPLRERKGDIITAAKVRWRRTLPQMRAKSRSTPQLQQALLAHDWPGNVRELENMIRKLVVLRDPQLISRDVTERVSRCTRRRSPPEPWRQSR